MPAERTSMATRTDMPGISKIHFVGAGGSGMCGIAEALHSEGYQVSGSDLTASATTERLSRQGISLHIGHNAKLAIEADAVVISAAIPEDNLELTAAKANSIPVFARAEMLAEMMRHRYGIAIAGTHGKTTTAAFSAEVLILAGRNPSFVIGGLLGKTNTHAQIGSGKSIVVEADESDKSFLRLRPEQAIVTSIDQDHMTTYDADFKNLQNAFVIFLEQLPEQGTAILCGDDVGVSAILPRLAKKKLLTYGFGASNDFRAENYQASAAGCRFDVKRPDQTDTLTVVLPVPGRHNACNALAVVALAAVEKIADAPLLEALATSKGVARRFTLHQNLEFAGRNIDLIDDYGHHPTELAAVLTTVRDIYPNKRLVLAFQPHRHSRTADHFDDFVRVLNEADMLLIQDTYAAFEAPIKDMDGAHLCEAIASLGKQQPQFAENYDVALAKLSELIRSGDVLIVLGAGDIDSVAKQILGGGV